MSTPEARQQEAAQLADILLSWNGEFGNKSNILCRTKGFGLEWKKISLFPYNFSQCDYRVGKETITPLNREQIIDVIGCQFMYNSTLWTIIGPIQKDDKCGIFSIPAVNTGISQHFLPKAFGFDYDFVKKRPYTECGKPLFSLKWIVDDENTAE